MTHYVGESSEVIEGEDGVEGGEEGGGIEGMEGVEVEDGVDSRRSKKVTQEGIGEEDLDLDMVEKPISGTTGYIGSSSI